MAQERNPLLDLVHGAHAHIRACYARRVSEGDIDPVVFILDKLDPEAEKSARAWLGNESVEEEQGRFLVASTDSYISALDVVTKHIPKLLPYMQYSGEGNVLTVVSAFGLNMAVAVPAVMQTSENYKDAAGFAAAGS